MDAKILAGFGRVDVTPQTDVPLRGVGNCLLGYPAQVPAEKPRLPGRIIKID